MRGRTILETGYWFGYRHEVPGAQNRIFSKTCSAFFGSFPATPNPNPQIYPRLSNGWHAIPADWIHESSLYDYPDRPDIFTRKLTNFGLDGPNR